MQVLTNLERASERLLDLSRRPASKQDECKRERHLKRQFALNPLTIARQFWDQVYRIRKIPGRVCRSAALQCLLARSREVINGLADIVTTAVMARQLAN